MIKTNMFVLLSAMLLSLSACKEAPKADEAKVGEAKEVLTAEGSVTWQVDTGASKFEWIGTKLSTYHSGTVEIKSGELLINNGTLTGGLFTMNMPTLKATNKDEATNKKLTGHLMSPDFFDVAKYPESRLVITSVEPFSGTADNTGGSMAEISEYAVSDPNVTISGNLTIKDITKNITFPAKVTVNNSGMDAVTKFNIDRKQWNLVYPGMPDDLIQDLIWFGISIHAGGPDSAMK